MMQQHCSDGKKNAAGQSRRVNHTNEYAAAAAAAAAAATTACSKPVWCDTPAVAIR